MGIDNIQVLIDKGETMETQGGDPEGDPQKDESPSPPQPVDDPNLPPEGDPEDFDEEPVPDEDFDPQADNDETADNFEAKEDPNDLSGIDKEFDDEEDDEGE